MTNLLLVGLILVLALAGGHLVKVLRVPEVVGYFFVGLFLGPSFSNILDHDAVTTLEVFSEIALGLILFSIGSIFEFDNLRAVGRRSLELTGYVMAGTILLVSLTLTLLGSDWRVALLLGTIATEISPIATILVLRELRSSGPLTESVNNLLALNNVGCLAVFGVATFLVRLISGADPGVSFPSFFGREFFLLIWGIIGSVALGVLLGYVLGAWGRRVDEHGEVLILVLGMILLAVGASHLLGLSSLIATMALGATLINLAKESRHLFDVLGKTDPPLYAIFFVLAGAHLEIASLKVIGIAGIAYTVSRIVGKVSGAWIGAARLGYPVVVRNFLGISLIAHAGVAIGLALQLRTIFPEVADTISAIILGSVLINEVAGPMLTKLAIGRAGERHVEAHHGAFEEI